jgi:hypothetical protein
MVLLMMFSAAFGDVIGPLDIAEEDAWVPHPIGFPARNESDMSSLSNDLLQVVDRTVAPAAQGLWVKGVG